MTSFVIIPAVLVILTTLWNQVECLPTGAPAEACTTLTPALPFHIDPPQSIPVPYEVDLLSLDDGEGFSYVPGETYSSMLYNKGRVLRNRNYITYKRFMQESADKSAT